MALANFNDSQIFFGYMIAISVIIIVVAALLTKGLAERPPEDLDEWIQHYLGEEGAQNPQDIYKKATIVFGTSVTLNHVRKSLKRLTAAKRVGRQFCSVDPCDFYVRIG